MSAFRYYYFELGPLLVICAPLIVMVAGILFTLKMPKRRWTVHVPTFVAMFAVLPAYARAAGILDPTTIDYPGPGDGFLVLIYGFFLLPAVLVYAIYAWITRKCERPAAC